MRTKAWIYEVLRDAIHKSGKTPSVALLPPFYSNNKVLGMLKCILTSKADVVQSLLILTLSTRDTKEDYPDQNAASIHNRWCDSLASSRSTDPFT